MKKKNLFYFLHILAIVLNISLFILPTQALWLAFDTYLFQALNSSIVEHPIQQMFWALGNIKITDIFGALFLLTAFLLYIFEARDEERQKRIEQLLYTIIWFEISILCCKQVITPICENFHLSRHGPTVVLPNAFMLSEVVPWCKVKDSSYFCYPADHAAIVFQWCAFMWFFAGWKRGLFVLISSMICILPRLISGAHWASDLLVGSGSIVMVAMAWAVCTPMYYSITNGLHTFVSFLYTGRNSRIPCEQEHV